MLKLKKSGPTARVSPSLATGHLREIYKTISDPPETTYKTLVKVIVPRGASHESAVVSTNKSTENLTVNHYGTRRAEPLVFIDQDGIKKPIQHETITSGSVYVVQSSLSRKRVDFEWMLLFKIDCDISRKKTGSIESALQHYASDSSTPPSIAYVIPAPKEFAGPRGRPKPKSNSEDFLERYGDKGADVRKWIDEKADELDADDVNFRHEKYIPNQLLRASQWYDASERSGFSHDPFLEDLEFRLPVQKTLRKSREGSTD